MALSLPGRSGTSGSWPSRTSTLPRSQVERLWLIGGGVVAALLALIGYLFFINPQRSSTSDVESRISSAQVQNGTLQARLNGLRAENKNLPRYQAALATAQRALPGSGTNSVSDFVRSLQSIGGATGATVTGVTIGAPVAVAPVAPATPTTAAPSTTTAAGATPVASAYSMAITTQVAGDPKALSAFLLQLQTVQPRAVLITSITEAGGTTAGQTGPSGASTLSLVMQAFVAPSVPSAPGSAGAPLPTTSAHP